MKGACLVVRVRSRRGKCIKKRISLERDASSQGAWEDIYSWTGGKGKLVQATESKKRGVSIGFR